MRARSFMALCALTAMGAALLAGCSGGSSSNAGVTPATALTPAETLVGKSLLPPDGVVVAASEFEADQLPPGVAALPADGLPPA